MVSGQLSVYLVNEERERELKSTLDRVDISLSLPARTVIWPNKTLDVLTPS